MKVVYNINHAERWSINEFMLSAEILQWEQIFSAVVPRLIVYNHQSSPQTSAMYYMFRAMYKFRNLVISTLMHAH